VLAAHLRGWDAVTTIVGGMQQIGHNTGFTPLVMPINEMSGLHYMLLVGVPALGNKSFERRRPESLLTVSLSLSPQKLRSVRKFSFFHPTHPSYTFAVRSDLKKHHEVRRKFCPPQVYMCIQSV
jgi:hypothetical protein